MRRVFLKQPSLLANPKENYLDGLIGLQVLLLREGMREKPSSYINIFPEAKAKKISIKMTRVFSDSCVCSEGKFSPASGI